LSNAATAYLGFKRALFHAESFNALNHTNLAVPEQNINSPAFGQIAAVYDPRIFQFGLQLKF